MRRPRVLFLAHLLPWPLEGGGQIKAFHTLRLLSSRYDVRLLAFVRRPKEASPENLAPLRSLCAGGVETVLLPRSRLRDVRFAARSLWRRESFLVTRDFDEPMARAVAEADYDLLHIDHLQMAQFVGAEWGGKIVLDQHNIEHRIPQRMAESGTGSRLMRWFARQEWPKLRDFEIASCRHANRVLTVSAEDRDGLIALDGSLADKITVTPIGVDLAYWGGVRRRVDACELLSVGTMYWPPNTDALHWFCADILPRLRAEIPDLPLNIVGARPTASIRALGTNDTRIRVTGTVADVRPFGEQCGVFIVPLRSGSGMRVKILTAMAMGLPVVSTTVGAEGIRVTDNENILLADTPEAFATAVLRLLRDPDFAQRVGEAGRDLMRRDYSWDAVGQSLLSAYAELLGMEGSQ